MTGTFECSFQPMRVIFGSGTLARTTEEADRLGLSKLLILTTPEQSGEAVRLRAILGNRVAGVFSGAVMHTPVAITEQALDEFFKVRADGLISIGGGSTIGLGKAIALRNDAPQIVIPTTYAGSEMTDITGQTENGEKTTRRTGRVLPETVIYDVDLTLGLPVGLSVTSGINAIAHAVEALYAQNANPVLSLLAEQGIAALFRALPLLKARPQDASARADALYGAWLCGICLGTGGVALHHKLCHVLGGSFDLPHAQTHTVVLPHALHFNAPAIGAAIEPLRRATGSESPAAALFDLAQSLGAETSLKRLGMPEDGIERAIAIALKNPYWNPRPINEAGLREVITAAWSGQRPV